MGNRVFFGFSRIEFLKEDCKDMNGCANSHSKEKRGKDLGGCAEEFAGDGHAPDRSGNGRCHHHQGEDDSRESPEEGKEKRCDDQNHEQNEADHVVLDRTCNLVQENRGTTDLNFKTCALKTLDDRSGCLDEFSIFGAREENRRFKVRRIPECLEGDLLLNSFGRVGTGFDAHRGQSSIGRDQEVFVERVGEDVFS